MQVITETIHADGSAWVAAVRIKGVLYRAAFVAGRLTVGLGPYKRPPSRPRWAEQAVRTWAEGRVKDLPEDWIELHRQMYSA